MPRGQASIYAVSVLIEAVLDEHDKSFLGGMEGDLQAFAALGPGRRKCPDRGGTGENV